MISIENEIKLIASAERYLYLIRKGDAYMAPELRASYLANAGAIIKQVQKFVKEKNEGN